MRDKSSNKITFCQQNHKKSVDKSANVAYNGNRNTKKAPKKGETKMAERRYTTEQLESAETIMKMLAAVPKEKRAEVVKATNIFMAGMEAQRAIDEPAMA